MDAQKLVQQIHSLPVCLAAVVPAFAERDNDGVEKVFGASD
jgi:hypothetical protein